MTINCSYVDLIAHFETGHMPKNGSIQYLPDKQVILHCIWLDNLIGYSSDMLRTAGFSSGPTAVYPVHSRPSRPCVKVGIMLHAFIDDNQLHMHCDLGNMLSSVNVQEECITTIGHWMSADQLKLNTKRTDVDQE